MSGHDKSVSFCDNLSNWFKSIMKQKPKLLLITAVPAVLFACWYNFYRGASQEPLHLLCVIGIIFILFAGGINYHKKHENFCLLVYSVFYSFFIILTRFLRTPNGSPFYLFVRLALPFILICSGVFLLLRGLLSALSAISLPSDAANAGNRKLFLAYFLITAICWTFIFLAVGPRICPDSVLVINEAISGALNDYHPVLYTLVLRLFILPFSAMGSITIGVYLFCFVQLLIFAFIVSFVAYRLHVHGAPLWLSIIAMLYYATSIVFAINSVSIWKDTLFNATLLLLMYVLYIIYESDGALLSSKRFMCKLALLFLAVCFLRGNGWFICVAVAILLCACYLRNIKSLLIWLLPVIIAVKLITGPVYAALNIGNLGNTEISGMMLQQVGRVASTGGEINVQQQEIIERVIKVEDIASLYNQHSPDYIKNSPLYNRAAFEENIGDFAKAWFEIGLQNPGSYFTAWALQTIGFYSLGYDDAAGIYYNDLSGHAGIINRDYISMLLPADLKVGDELLANLRMGSLGSMIWLVLFCAAFAIAMRERKKLIVLSPALLLWVGLLMGAPRHYEFRYIMVVPLCIPLILLLLLKKGVKHE